MTSSSWPGVVLRQIEGKSSLQHDAGNNCYVSDLARGVDTAVTVSVLSNDSCAEVGALRKGLMTIPLGAPTG
jgi:hypothetical protein